VSDASDPRDYVPDEWLVRATLGDAPNGAREAWDAWDAALAYVPPEALLQRVLARSARPAFRIHLLDAPNAAPRRPSLAARAAALFGVTGLSPAVLAAAVVVHAALGAALATGGDASSGAAALAPAVAERVVVVILPAVAMQTMPPGLRRELAVAVGQSIGATAVGGALPRRDRARLDTTASVLARFPAARVTLESDTAGRALATAELVQGYLVQRGVARARAPIVARPTGRGTVTVALDTAADLRR
jgi:hypothetical protein